MKKVCAWLLFVAFVAVVGVVIRLRCDYKAPGHVVLGVVDGDTIKIRYGGVEESVRLLGVDTPETVHPDIPPEPYGAEATAFTKRLLQGEKVVLRFGRKQRDRYGRLLAFVYRTSDNQLVNLEIIRCGFGRVYGVDFPKRGQFIKAQREAQTAKKGIWGLSD